MRAYLIRRLLLMIPTFFGVSLVVWLILSFTPQPPLASQGPGTLEEGKTTGEAGGVGQAIKVFRAQYGLDKPPILNFYYGLTRDEVRMAIEALDDPARPMRERNDAQERLIQWGYYAVPALVELLRETEGTLRDKTMGWLVTWC